MVMTPQERVGQALDGLGLPSHVVEFEASTRTAADAAAAVGCEPGQIVKTLVFMAEGRPAMALVAGDRQVDTSKLAELLGVSRKRLKMGSPEEVLDLTGYPVGGVAPVGALRRCDVVVDESLRRYDSVWAAAGSGNAVFEARLQDLVAKVEGQWAAITRDPS
jgi:Cys-tRNA(Pro) deacylase